VDRSVLVRPNNPEQRLIVAGGGTGGHVLAGVAVADAWKQSPGGGSVIFVGAQGGIEEKLVPRAGYQLQVLKLGSLNRVSIAKKLKTLTLLPFSLLKSFSILMAFKPHGVIGVGGYASGPLVLAARILRGLGMLDTRTAIIEQNSVPGMTNRWLGRWVDRVFCAFPGTEKQFPGTVILTGNPVRAAMKPLTPAARDPFTVFIFGGSLGALGINSLVINSLPELVRYGKKIRFIHQTGEQDFERVRKAYEAAGVEARVEKFIHDMAGAYAESSLLICRSGSSTMAEIAAVGRASVLIPFPFASDNHQEKNARVFVDAGAARLLVQKDAKPADLLAIIDELVREPAKVDAMEKSVSHFYRPQAAQSIVSELINSKLRPGSA
jgi:UDP-N-acetylglucosamine--N-acetylmuramyl-(pentapeptide) pyrophosphoryl-undecaprenol N-acetylglucosamine transferase